MKVPARKDPDSDDLEQIRRKLETQNQAIRKILKNFQKDNKQQHL